MRITEGDAPSGRPTIRHTEIHMPSRTIQKRILSPTAFGAAAVALAAAPAALAATHASGAGAGAGAAGLTPMPAAVQARSAPFTIGLSARSVAAGSKVTISGLANARAGTPLTIISDALSSSRLVDGVPAVRTSTFVEGTYRAVVVVPPATRPGTYAIVLRASGRKVASTSIMVTARSRGGGGRPGNRRACAGIGFTVLHNDQSGGVRLPAGGYRVTSPNLDCSTASADFTTFLDRYNGAIPGWTASASGAGRGTFTQRATGRRFTVTYGR